MAVTVFYANENMEDVGVLKGFKLDMTISMETGNNDYEVRTSIGGIEMYEGYYVYAEDSEYGGIVDAKRINTKTNTLYYSGRTWRGMLESKVIIPPSGQDYYTASGDLNVVIGQLVNDFGLGELFYADSTLSGETVTNYQFYRYTDVYSGIMRLLSDLGYKLAIRFDTNQFKCKLSAEPIVDYGDSQEITSDLYDFDISKVGGTVNHLIGLGSGELKNRLVLHRYADADGRISSTQTFFGKDEIVDIYEYALAEDTQELDEQMSKRFQSLIGSDDIRITLNDVEADVGDKLTVYEENTGIEAIQYIQNKIITIDDDTMNVQHSTKTVGYSGVHGELASNTLNTVYPVGAVMCMSTNTNPETLLGGTWELIDKQFASKTFSNTDVITKSSTLISDITAYAVRGATSITIRLSFYFLAAYNSQADVEFGTLNVAKLGFDSSTYQSYVAGIMNTNNPISSADVAVLTTTITNAGVWRYYCTTRTIPAEHTIYLQTTLEIPYVDRLDSACDKFYFRRTA